MAIPKIRIKGFDTSYHDTTIGNNCSVNRGVRITRKELTDNGKYPVYQNTDYPMGYYNDFNVKANNPFVIVGGSAGLIGFSYSDFWAADDCVYFRDSTSLNNRYLYYLLLYNRLEIKKNVRGSSVPRLDRTVLKDLKISIPNITEQEAIADYFQSLDSLIEATDKKIATLKQTKQASLQSMFPQEGETKPRVRFKGFTDEWKKIEIGKYGDTYSGLSGKSKDDFGKGDAKYITFLNVLANAQINPSILESVDVKTGERQNTVQKGDILFNTSSETPEEVGLCSVLLEDIPNVYLNSFCFGFRPNNPAINSEFMVYLMRGHIGRSIMKVLAQGATRYNLSKKRLCETLIPIPTNIEEQKQIAEYFSNLDKQISIQEQRLEKLKQIKSACLKNMFV